MAKKVLIIRTGAIGDVVHSTIIQQSIMAKYPDSQIHFLTSKVCASLIKNDKNLKKVHIFDFAKSDNLFYLFKLGLTFRKEKFDIIINLSNTLRNKLLLILANPKKTVYRNRNRVHAVDAFFNSAKDAFDDIEKPSNLKLYLSYETTSAIETKIQNYPRPFFVISPGGEHDNARQGRIWPIDYWIKLSDDLVQKYGGTVFVIGSKGEAKYHEKIQSSKNAVLLSGELNIDESAALISKADLFISGDSGPLHIASALDVKTIGIMGATPATACGPYGDKGYSISPIYKCDTNCNRTCDKLNGSIYAPCITSITPEVVLDFIEKNITL